MYIHGVRVSRSTTADPHRESPEKDRHRPDRQEVNFTAGVLVTANKFAPTALPRRPFDSRRFDPPIVPMSAMLT
ncbi:hypothetical protein [Saccharopolyspora taberi]|uniref:Uncharacterized protein n=1 Tax=Saccharopolyspora taberi TaxID=60895 RepID=A0ABN3V1Z6_9PSEU